MRYRANAWVVLSAALALVFLIGCEGSEGRSCAVDEDCDSDQFCQGDVFQCVLPCDGDGDCSSDQCNAEPDGGDWCEVDDFEFGSPGGGSARNVNPADVADALATDDIFLGAVVTLLTTLFIDELRGPSGPSGTIGAEGPEGPRGPTGPVGLQGPAGSLDLSRASFFSVEEGDLGAVEGRALTFNKNDGESAVRVSYYDIFGVVGDGCSCAWSMMFDGAACSEPGPVGTLVSAGTTRGETLLGYCAATAEGPLGSGEVRVSVRVEARDGCDCTTGDPISAGAIEVSEVR